MKSNRKFKLLRQGECYGFMFETKEDEGTEQEEQTTFFGEYIGTEKVGDVVFLIIKNMADGVLFALNPRFVRIFNQVDKSELENAIAMARASSPVSVPVAKESN